MPERLLFDRGEMMDNTQSSCALTAMVSAMPASPFVTYSQNGEDVLLWRALKHVQKGFYIDVGAQDPVNFSVTKAFYDRGWHGINVEPVRHWYDCLVACRPHDINLRVAASDQRGSVKLFEVEGTGLSTADGEFARRHEAAGFVVHEHSVDCATLDQICSEHGVKTVHFLKIDCEGAEKKVLGGLSFSNVRPWIVLAEATEPLSTTPTWKTWEHLLTNRGYQFVFFDGLNRYYVAQEHAELVPAFDTPVNVFDDVQRASDIAMQQQIGMLRGEIDGLKGAAANAALRAENIALATERDKVTAERDQVAAERDQIAAERDQIAAERDQIAAERDQVAAERDQLVIQCNAMAAACSSLEARLAGLLTSRSWRVMAPMRGVSLAIRWMYRRFRAVVRWVLQRGARMARPWLRGLSHSPLVRRLVVGMLGKHSRVTERARRFLFGGPHPDDVVVAQQGAEDETARLHRTLRSVLVGRQEDLAAEAAMHGPLDPDRVMEQVRAKVMYRIAHRLLR